MYYPCSENKGADQLRGHHEADLRLCFRICKNPVFSQRGSNHHSESFILLINIPVPEVGYPWRQGSALVVVDSCSNDLDLGPVVAAGN